jgi:uncharacterized metal-binding protein YceD (DUF177 family)
MAMNKIRYTVRKMASSAKQSKQRISKPTLILADLPSGREVAFEIVFDATQRAETIKLLGLLELDELRFVGKLSPRDQYDWKLTGKLGASAVMACVLTLDPVKIRLDDTVSLTFLSCWKEPKPDSVSEMDENVDSEPLSDLIDLAAIAREALALALPDYPRKKDAVLSEAVFAEPGTAAMTDEDAKPFAELAALKKRFEKVDNSTE